MPKMWYAIEGGWARVDYLEREAWLMRGSLLPVMETPSSEPKVVAGDELISMLDKAPAVYSDSRQCYLYRWLTRVDRRGVRF